MSSDQDGINKQAEEILRKNFPETFDGPLQRRKARKDAWHAVTTVLSKKVPLGITGIVSVSLGAAAAAFVTHELSIGNLPADTSTGSSSSSPVPPKAGPNPSLMSSRADATPQFFNVGKHHYELDLGYHTLDGVKNFDGSANFVEADAVLYNVDANNRRLHTGSIKGPRLYVSDATFDRNGQNSSLSESKDGCGLTQPNETFESTATAQSVACETVSSLLARDYTLTVLVSDADNPVGLPIPMTMPVHLEPVSSVTPGLGLGLQ